MHSEEEGEQEGGGSSAGYRVEARDGWQRMVALENRKTVVTHRFKVILSQGFQFYVWREV